MAIPSGYTALDFVGFTDKGTYANNITYVKNDLAHYGGDIWKCLVDNTIGVTPSEGVNWTLWIGAPTNLVERIIAPLETNPATVAYAVGRQIIYDDWLWEVIAPIAVGDSLIDYAVDPTNANIKKSPSVETQVLAIKNGLGTAAAKDFTTSVTSGSADLATSGAVYTAVDAVNTALTNALTNVDITGTTNNIGSTIPLGKYFYLNGTLVKAKTDIANGATFTLNTNYEVVTAGGLNDLSLNHYDVLDTLDNSTASVTTKTSTIPNINKYKFVYLVCANWENSYRVASALIPVPIFKVNTYPYLARNYNSESNYNLSIVQYVDDTTITLKAYGAQEQTTRTLVYGIY